MQFILGLNVILHMSSRLEKDAYSNLIDSLMYLFLLELKILKMSDLLPRIFFAFLDKMTKIGSFTEVEN